MRRFNFSTRRENLEYRLCCIQVLLKPQHQTRNELFISQKGNNGSIVLESFFKSKGWNASLPVQGPECVTWYSSRDGPRRQAWLYWVEDSPRDPCAERAVAPAVLWRQRGRGRPFVRHATFPCRPRQLSRRRSQPTASKKKRKYWNNDFKWTRLLIIWEIITKSLNWRIKWNINNWKSQCELLLIPVLGEFSIVFSMLHSTARFSGEVERFILESSR